MTKNRKKSDKNGKPAKRDKRGKRDKRLQLARTLAPVGDVVRKTPAAFAVAAGTLVAAGIASLWRIRR